MKVFRIITLLLFFVLLFHADLSAQPGPPPDDPDAVPIHGAIYLLIAGAALGFRKLFSQSKE